MRDEGKGMEMFPEDLCEWDGGWAEKGEGEQRDEVVE
jgi:hypothetical protein